MERKPASYTIFSVAFNMSLKNVETLLFLGTLVSPFD